MNKLMLNFLVFLALIISTPYTSYAQKCKPYDNFIYQQSQIDDFKKNYPGCKEIDGWLTITGEDIINLDSLGEIEIFNGGISLNNTNLKNLFPINNVDSITGLFSIINNEMLESLLGFDNVISLTNISIRSNSKLKEINAFQNLTNVTHDLIITDNPELETIQTCENLRSCRSLRIEDNINLLTLTGFNLLESINGILRLVRNINLKKMNIAASLKHVEAEMWIRYNKNLDTLIGFDHLEYCRHLSLIGNGFRHLNHFNKLKEAEIWISEHLYLRSIQCCDALEKSKSVIFHPNIGLKSIDGFKNVQTIDSLLIWGGSLDSLITIKGFEQLKEVRVFSLVFMRGLSEFTAFKNLERVSRLTISEAFTGNQNFENFSKLKHVEELNLNAFHSEFTDLHGFRNIDYTKIKDIKITKMTRDIVCHVEPICRYLEEGVGPYLISGNWKAGCRNKEEILELCAVSTEDMISADGISIYPNPAEGRFAIDAPDGWDVRIYDKMGRPVSYNRYADMITLHDNIPGVYIVEIRAEGKVHRQKLLVLR